MTFAATPSIQRDQWRAARIKTSLRRCAVTHAARHQSAVPFFALPTLAQLHEMLRVRLVLSSEFAQSLSIVARACIGGKAAAQSSLLTKTCHDQRILLPARVC